MTIQFSDTVRNAMGDARETAIGTAPILEIRSGAQPANCAAADTGTLLASMTLPSDWLSNAAAGVKSKLGTWQDTSANNAGTAGHYRIKNSAGSVCHEQGSITATGGGGDMTLDNTNIAPNQSITITAYGTTEGGA